MLYIQESINTPDGLLGFQVFKLYSSIVTNTLLLASRWYSGGNDVENKGNVVFIYLFKYTFFKYNDIFGGFEL